MLSFTCSLAVTLSLPTSRRPPTHGINTDTCTHLGDAVGGSAGFRGVALVDGLQESQEVVVAGLLFFLSGVGLAEF